MRGAAPSTPPTTPYTPLSARRWESLSFVIYPARRSPQGGRSARIFPLRGRYARLLRRSRVAGIASAPRLARLTGHFSGLCLARRGARVCSPNALKWQRTVLPAGEHTKSFPHEVRTIFLPHCVLPAQCTESAGGKPFFRRAGRAVLVEKDSAAKRSFKRKRGRARRRSPPRRGGSSDAGRTLGPRSARDSGRPNARCRAAGRRQGDALRKRTLVKDGCPDAG